MHKEAGTLQRPAPEEEAEADDIMFAAGDVAPPAREARPQAAEAGHWDADSSSFELRPPGSTEQLHIAAALPGAEGAQQAEDAHAAQLPQDASLQSLRQGLSASTLSETCILRSPTTLVTCLFLELIAKLSCPFYVDQGYVIIHLPKGIGQMLMCWTVLG